MRKLQATLSQDGEMRFDMRIPFRVGLWDIAAALHVKYELVDKKLPWSRSKCLQAVEDYLRAYGSGNEGVWDDVPESTAERLFEYSAKLFPELTKGT